MGAWTTRWTALVLAVGLAGVTAIPARAVAPPDLMDELRTGARADADAAVVIGASAYPFLFDVQYADRDAEAMYRTLVYTRGISPGQIRLITGSPTREEIVAAVREAAALVGDGGLLWVYFAGHGAASTTTRERVLVGADAKATAASLEARAVRLADIETIARDEGAARTLIVVDACFSGAGRDGGALLEGARPLVPRRPPEPARDVVVWSATVENELSGPLESARHGMFTYFVVGALRGWADGELDGGRGDGEVTLAEAQAYVVMASRAMSDGTQHPSVDDRGQVSGWALASGRSLERGPDLAALKLGADERPSVIAAEPPLPPVAPPPPSSSPPPASPPPTGSAAADSGSGTGSDDALAGLFGLAAAVGGELLQEEAGQVALASLKALVGTLSRDGIFADEAQVHELSEQGWVFVDQLRGGDAETEIAGLQTYLEAFEFARVRLGESGHHLVHVPLARSQQARARLEELGGTR